MKTQRNSDLAKIHIAKKQIGMDEDTYRAMLQTIAGVTSAADLTVSGRCAVLAHLRRAGFKSVNGKGHTFPGKPDFKKLEGTGKLAMVRKIEAYLAQARRPWSYAHGTAKRMHGVNRIEWCNHSQLHAIIAAFEKDARRHGRPTC